MNSIWNKNVESFTKRFPQLSQIYKQIIEQITLLDKQKKSLQDFEPFTTIFNFWNFSLAKNGAVISTQNNLTLHSSYNPQREALNSVLPLGIQEFKRVINLSSSCLAMFMPFKTQELNDEGGNYYGINQLSQNVIFADKKKLKNHNGMIFGQSGSGKSVFAKSEIISTFVNYPDDQIIIIDPQSEYGGLAAETDGTVISFDSTKEFYLNPMDVD